MQLGRDDAGGDAGTPGATAAGSRDRTSGSAGPAAEARRRGKPRHAWPSSRPVAADHPPAAAVNRDASLFLVAPGSGPAARRASGRREGFSGSAARPRRRSPVGLARRSRGCSRLATVAAAADDHLIAATRAHEQAAGDRLGLRCVADETWTNAIIGRILVLHSCPARCAARRRCRTAKLRAAPCLPSSLPSSRRAVLYLSRIAAPPPQASWRRR